MCENDCAHYLICSKAAELPTGNMPDLFLPYYANFIFDTFRQTSRKCGKIKFSGYSNTFRKRLQGFFVYVG